MSYPGIRTVLQSADGSTVTTPAAGYAAFWIDANNVIRLKKADGSVVAFANDAAVVHNVGNETVGGEKTFTVSPLVPTAAPGTSSLVAASTEFVQAAGSALLDGISLSVPAALFSSPVVFSNSGGAWGGSLELAPVAAKSLLANDAGASAAPAMVGYSAISLDEWGSAAGDVSFGSHRLTDLAAAVAGNDGVNLAQVQSLIANGAHAYLEVQAVATANVDIASAPTSIDGFALAAGDCLLLTGQADASQNGPWAFAAAGAALARPLDYAGGSTVRAGFIVVIGDGATYKGYSAFLQTDNVVVDTIATTWALAPSVLGYVGNAPVTVSGNQMGLSYGGGLTLAGGTLVADTGTAGHKLPYLDGANAWSATQTFAALVSGAAFSVATAAQASITPAGAGTVGLGIQAAAAQTAAYESWFDSAGNVVFSAPPAGSGDPRAQLQLYNTLESAPANYERLALYFDNPNSLARVETQNGGAGTLRALAMQGGGGRTLVGGIADDGATALQVNGAARVNGSTVTTGNAVVNGRLNLATSGTATSAAQLSISGNSSQPAWGSIGIYLNIAGNTQTDTTSSGTVGQLAFSRFSSPLVAATNTVTYGTAYTVLIQGPPTAGTNVTITTPWALYIQSGDVKLIGRLNISSNSTAAPTAMLGVGYTGSFPAWNNTGILAAIGGGTLTDTTSSGTNANVQAMSAFSASNIAATNATTYSGGITTLYVAGPPVASTNATFTGQTYALLTGSGNVGFLTGSTMLGVGVAPAAKLHLSGNLTANAWGTNGIGIFLNTTTSTDNSTAASGTAAQASFVSIGQMVLAATNASVTTTAAFGLYFAGAPKAGANQSITTTYGMYMPNIATNAANFVAARIDVSSGATTSATGLQLGTNAYAGVMNGAFNAPFALRTGGTTLTDNGTAASGTLAQFSMVAFSTPTLAATNASVTTTQAANVWVGGAVVAGSNETITSSYGIYVGTANVTANVTNSYGIYVNAQTNGATNYSGLFAGGIFAVTGTTINLNVSNNGTVNIGTGTTTSTVSIGNSANNVKLGSSSAIATGATAGFIVLPTCAGAPTGGIGSSGAGNAYLIYDTTNNKLWINTSGGSTWKGVVLT